MAPDLTSEDWRQIRYDYEHTDRAVGDICAEHGISSGTLRDRMRRWGWARRRVPIPHEGPPPALAPQSETGIETRAACVAAVPQAAAGDDAGAQGEPDNGAIAPRLQSAVARVLPAIEATVAKLAAGPTPAREMEQAARALSSLTRTMRELNGLLGQHREAAPYDDGPEDIDEFRFALARKMDAFIAARTGQGQGVTPGQSAPQGHKTEQPNPYGQGGPREQRSDPTASQDD